MLRSTDAGPRYRVGQPWQDLIRHGLGRRLEIGAAWTDRGRYDRTMHPTANQLETHPTMTGVTFLELPRLFAEVETRADGP